ncbi:molybdopterin molybdotransferase [Monaibacterium marinum]|uniref:Molybdopterin molybdenumtransferase n=1 Tax=Pontivivens marinum TaxID=1690039 RepID=A0A2C9CQ07_9RHOB|nr:molybdopterin molybdotransferase MoeA [Monaibacterium marinum]SOH93611.1 molybdopterin molybdotransferase [Monaibacterium marinum]
MIPVAEALDRICALLSTMPVEHVPLRECAGRILAQPVSARRTQPPFAASAMDGYAIGESDAQVGHSLRVVGESQAGLGFNGEVSAGCAVRIFTGAPVPSGAQRVVIQEDVTRSLDSITLNSIDQGLHIRPAGADFSKGDIVSAGLITPARIALLAAMNIAEVPVYRRPVVALIATGDELVVPGEQPGPDQIVSSNIYAVTAIVQAAGATPRILPIAPDTLDGLRDVLDMARGADLIVTLGGASVGDHDLVAQVAGDAGLALDFYKVAMRPGKPLMAGRLGDAIMIGLPGNPVSAFVCAHVFLRPALDRMLGGTGAPLPRSVMPLTKALGPNAGREHYMRAVREGDGVRVYDRQDSSLLSVLDASDILVVRAPNDPARIAGDMVETIPLH